MFKRDAHEAVRRGFEEQGQTSGKYRARGTLAYAKLYTDNDGVLTTTERRTLAPRRRFYVERKLAGRLRGQDVWVTCEDLYQRATLEECRNMIRGFPNLRIMVLSWFDTWVPDAPTTTTKPKVFFSERARLAWEASQK